MSTAAPVRSGPPEERFWQRYSPHHEFSLSSVSSFALHLLFIGVAALLCMLPFFNRDNKPMPLDAVALGAGDNGGRPEGEVGNRGDGDGGENRGDVQNPPDERPRFDEKVPSPDVPRGLAPRVPPLPDVTDLELRPIELSKDILDRLEARRKTTAKDLQNGSADEKKAPKGDGPGAPGGRIMSKREKRMLRWTMLFNTRDGKDYAQQLKFLGATLAVLDPDDPHKGTVYRDISAPAKGKVEELKEVDQIWWIDDKVESVRALCKALEIKPVPKKVIAFLPVELEKQLLNLELKYAKGKAEEEIEETVFELKNKGGERYEPVVIRQSYLR